MDSHLRSGTKSLIWRILGVIWLAMITWIFTKSYLQTSLTTFIHHGVFLIVFYLHERAWLTRQLHRPRIRNFIKAITYEVILGNIILGLITYLVIGDIKKMTYITLIYIQSKILLYFFYDWLWDKKIKSAFCILIVIILFIYGCGSEGLYTAYLISGVTKGSINVIEWLEKKDPNNINIIDPNKNEKDLSDSM